MKLQYMFMRLVVNGLKIIIFGESTPYVEKAVWEDYLGEFLTELNKKEN